MEQKFKIGDILLLKPEKNNWLGKCIAKLTDSDVSHAVMVYGADSMIEMTAAGVGVYGIDQIEGDEVYIMRMVAPPEPDMLIKSANTYLKAEVRFDFPALIFLAGLLVYRCTVPKKGFYNVSDQIIKLACIQLDHLMKQVISPDTPVMVCAQLVYQIYENCGPQYHIQMDKDILETKKSPGEEAVGVYDDDNAQALLTQEELSQVGEELAKELFTIIESEEVEDEPWFNTPMHEPFKKRVVEIMETLELDIAPESLFATAGDMLNHSQNLKKIGMCGIKRKA